MPVSNTEQKGKPKTALLSQVFITFSGLKTTKLYSLLSYAYYYRFYPSKTLHKIAHVACSTIPDYFISFPE